MSLTKYAYVEEILDVKGSNQRLAFNYGDKASAGLSKYAALKDNLQEDDGYLYVRCRAISSRVNKNNDGWPSKELMNSYETFNGRPVFVDHNNDDPKRTRGVIVSSDVHVDDEGKTSALDPYYSTAPDNHKPPTWVELLIEVDAKTFPRLAKSIRTGDIDAVSMGANIEKSICSVCAHEASTPSEYCDHIKQKGITFEITSADGQKMRKKAYEDCYGVNFFEISFVFDPADTTALISEKTGKKVASSEECDYCGHDITRHADLNGACQWPDCGCPRFESYLPGEQYLGRFIEPKTAGEGLPPGAMGLVDDAWVAIHPKKGEEGVHEAIQQGDMEKAHQVAGELSTEPFLKGQRNPYFNVDPVHIVQSVSQQIQDGSYIAKVANPIEQFIEPSQTKHDQDNHNYIPQSEQITAPQKVDTLRPEHLCPICRAADMISDPDGIERCPTCGHVQEPEPLNNPDLGVARDTDIRMDNTQTSDPQGNPEIPVTDGTESVEIAPVNTVTPVAARNQSTSGREIVEMFETVLTTTSSEIADTILPTREAGQKKQPILQGNTKPSDGPKNEKIIADELQPREASYEDVKRVAVDFSAKVSKLVEDDDKRRALLERAAKIYSEADRRHIVRAEQSADGVVRSEEIVEETETKPQAVEVSQPQVEREPQPVAATEDKEAKLLAAMKLADDAIEIGLVERENKMAFIAEVEEETTESIKAREDMVARLKTAGLIKRPGKLAGLGFQRVPRLAPTASYNGNGGSNNNDLPDEALFL
jgi:hypothetical protein